MIIWLASYPKSGNTLVRSMIAAYLFSSDGIYNFDLIKNIKEFPHARLFTNLGYDIRNQKKTFKNYVKIQETFNRKDSVQFLKTHSKYFHYQKKHSFSNLDNTLGVVYIVRDPRNVLTSFSKFKNLSYESTLDFMTRGVGDQLTWTDNWAENFNSWKYLKSFEKYLLIKYEDLIQNRELTFLKILEFIHKLNNTKLTLDKKKLDNVVETTSFEYMQKLEKEKGFDEANFDSKSGEKIPFFFLGPKNDWKKLLDKEVALTIENSFKKEMKELGYL
tara:strand:- start:1048 stop:1869 length:822 start_codon:yes stop_codon:yes gene_type:complete